MIPREVKLVLKEQVCQDVKCKVLWAVLKTGYFAIEELTLFYFHVSIVVKYEILCV